MMDYTLSRRIGSGRFGDVYRGTRNVDGRVVAIKRVPVVKTTPVILHSEGVLWKRVSGHPNILTFEDMYKDDLYYYYVSEYCAFGELDVKQFRLNTQHVILSLLNAMIRCHRNYIVHGDIKPANILETERGVWKLGDFGACQEALYPSQGLTACKGTPFYIAPEILMRQEYGYNVDIWSFGVVVYQLWTAGNHPFYNGKDKKQLMDAIQYAPIQWESNMDAHKRDFLSRCLERDQTLRISSEEALEHFHHIMDRS
jgi:serine/threonine protein kinase